MPRSSPAQPDADGSHCRHRLSLPGPLDKCRRPADDRGRFHLHDCRGARRLGRGPLRHHRDRGDNQLDQQSAGVLAESRYGTTAACNGQFDLARLRPHHIAQPDVERPGDGTMTTLRVISTNGFGPHDVRGRRFVTVAAPIVSAVAASAITGAGATICLDRPHQLTSSQLVAGTTTAYGGSTSLDSVPTTSHRAPDSSYCWEPEAVILSGAKRSRRIPRRYRRFDATESSTSLGMTV